MKFSSFEKAAAAKKPVLIYGFGVEGRESLTFLNKHFPGLSVQIYDENIEEFKNNNDFEKYEIIVISAGISRQKIDKKYHEKITSGANIFFENLTQNQRKKIIAITGTKGKSTVTKLVFEILQKGGKKVEIAGNYGIPMLSVLDQIEDLDFIVLELSSYQLEYLKTSPHLVIFTNFYIDHIDRHGSVENYFEAKSNIFKHQKKGDFTFISANFPQFLPPAPQTFQNWDFSSKLVVCPSLNPDYFPQNSTFRAKHLLQNFGMIKALCEVLKIENEVLKKVCQNFKGLAHRLENVGVFQQINFINDANATTPDASEAAMKFVGENLGSLIVGGQDRKYDFSKMIEAILKYKPFVIILQSESGFVVQKLLENVGYTKFALVKNMQEIVKTAFEKTPKNKTALLSMGSPSYGYFKNFEEKGELFKKEILNFISRI